MPRTPNFDRAAADRYLDAVRAGARDDVAAAYAGVSERTAHAWRRRKEFGAEVDQARAELAVLAIGYARAAMKGDRAAAQWMTDRMAGDAELDRLRALTTDP